MFNYLNLCSFMYLKFVCRPSKMLKNGLCPLELSIIVDQERRIMRFQYYVKKEDFIVSKQRVRRNEEANNFMDSVKAKFHNIESEMLRRNLEVTAQSLVEVYNNGFAESKVSILSLFDAHNQEAKEKIKQNLIAQATYQKYLRTRYLLAQFLKTKLNKKDILVNDITPAMMEQFFVYLNGTMAKNTAIHKMKTLKKILKIAVEEGYIQAMPFKLKLKADPLLYEPLTVEEIRIIRQKEFKVARLAEVRDCFVFACYCGLAFSDLKNLSKKDILVDESGKEWIIKPRQKTKIISHIPLLPIAKEIWEKYNYQLPIPSNQKYNGYLHEIGAVCGINKNLHSHLARHTFATILLNSGVDLVSVSKILGHSNSRITEKTYAKMMPETIMKRVTEIADQII